MSRPHIAAVGAYAPAARLSAAEIAETWGRYKAADIESVAVPAPDEDALTMAYEAADRALEAAAVDPAALDYVGLATTTPPLEEETVLPHLTAMLGAEEDVGTACRTVHTGAGVGLLRTVTAGLSDGETGLVVASDAPQARPDQALGHGAGAGAAAVLLAPDGLATVTGGNSHSVPASGVRYRGRGESEVQELDVTPADRSTFRECVAAAVEGVEFDDADAAAIQAPDGNLPYQAADSLPVDSERIRAHATVQDLGDTGTASPLLGLALALADDAERVLIVGYGAGSTATAVTVDRSGSVPHRLALDPGEELVYADALRQRGELTGPGPEGGGGYVSLPAWERSLAQRYRLEAGRCPDCGALNMPPTGACGDCAGLVSYDPVELARRGVVEARSVISEGGAPPEFHGLQSRGGAYLTGIVAFEGPDGDAASLPLMFTDTDHEDVAVGDEVTVRIRRLFRQEGVVRYGLKATLAD